MNEQSAIRTPQSTIALPPLIVLLGPTAVGKTELSLSLCEQFDGEIVGADSRQIYRLMDIGTAKPTPAEMQRVPHHLIGIRDPDDVLSVAEYQRLAFATIDTIHQRRRIPFLVGGTALYIRAIVNGLQIPEVPPNPALRAELETQLALDGIAALFARLQTLDPASAAVIDRQNPRRVLRALEIVITTGRSKVELEGENPPPYQILELGLTRPRVPLYRRIDQRVEGMIEHGLIEETQRLLNHGYSPTLPAMTSLGYREIAAYLRGEMTVAEAITTIKTETHRFVRRQETFFRKMKDVMWFDLEIERFEAIADRIKAFVTAM